MSIDSRHLELLHLIRFDDGELSDNPVQSLNGRIACTYQMKSNHILN